MKKHLQFLLLCCAAVAGGCKNEASSGTDAEMDRFIDELMSRMTIEEKIGQTNLIPPDGSIISGPAVDSKTGERIKRNEIGAILNLDGAAKIRETQQLALESSPNRIPLIFGMDVIHGYKTIFPIPLGLSATWNMTAIEEAARISAVEASANGICWTFSPMVDIARDARWGRIAEGAGEDPWLGAQIAKAYVRGYQGDLSENTDILACMKHYALYGASDGGKDYNTVDMGRQRMFNVYMPPFKAAVEAGVGSVMSAFNEVDGIPAGANKWLLTDVLREEWGFDGFVITDWLQTRSTEKAALAGLDISMPGGEGCGFGRPLLDAVREGRVPESVIDDKVRRILRIYERIGALNGRNLSAGATINTPQHQETALRLAEESIVLLRNEGGMLPLRRGMKILVTGPNADKHFCLPGMGGSSGIESPYETTVLDGLRNLPGNADVSYFPTEQLGGFSPIPAEAVHSDPHGSEPGWRATYAGAERTLVRTEPQIDFMWEMKSPDKTIPVESFSANFQGWITPPVSGVYTLRLTVGGWCAIFPEGCYGAPTIVADDSREGERTVTATIQLQKDEPYFFCVNYSKNRECDASVRLEWKLPESSESAEALARLDAAAREADAVIFVGCLDHSLDTEVRDRLTMEFPQDQ